MIRQRIRITGLVTVALAAATAAPSAMAMPDGRTTLPDVATNGPASLAVRSNPDRQGQATRATPVARHVPVAVAVPTYYVRAEKAVQSPDQQVPSGYVRAEKAVQSPDQQVPSGARPTGGSIKQPGTPTGSGFDWAALGIGIGALALLGLSIGVFRSASRRTRHPRQRVAASS
jgi:hypothetical protein